MEIKDGNLIISLDHIAKGLKIVFKDADERFFISADYIRHNEAEYQFTEGAFYSYELFEEIDAGKNKTDWEVDMSQGLKGVFKPFSKSDTTEGIFAPNTFVGTLKVPLMKEDQKAHFQIEVHSSKIDYRDKDNLQNKLGQYRSEYQLMLEEIVEHCMDLIMQYNVPIEQTYESGIEQISEKELYQRFIFVRSLFKNQDFEEAVQKIISNPATKWETEIEERDVRSIRRFTSKNIRQLVSGNNRMNLPRQIGELTSIPNKISSSRKIESVDTAENRFIKHIISSFQEFCQSIHAKLEKAKLSTESAEVKTISQRLDNLLNQPFFKEINRPETLKINSPVLQRRSGYRELLRAWLRFHVTAQLSWKFEKDEDNLFTGGKKDIASLYEYWVFFVLLNTLLEKFGDHSSKNTKDWIEALIVSDKYGLGLTLQEGKTRAFEFEYTQGKRPLMLKFYYNRSFPGGRKYAENKSAGSYSKSFRPDYTLSVWPLNLEQNKAEETESIVHIHFDAKYKVDFSYFKEDNPTAYELSQLENTEQLEPEEIAAAIVTGIRENEERQGIYKNVDLYKMHAYKDAIRRSGGAYILYPGTSQEGDPFRGFHEILPGVGAFSLRPNNEGQASENIKQFIDKIIANLEDVLSQREEMAKSIYKVYAEIPSPIKDSGIDQLCREMQITANHKDIQVLVGYYKNSDHLNWIENNLKYNIRFGEKYQVSGPMLSVKFLVLYGDGGFHQTHIYELDPQSGIIIAKNELKTIGKTSYPGKPSHDFYYLYQLKRKIQLDDFIFNGESEIVKKKLSELKTASLPFTISLSELSKIRISR